MLTAYSESHNTDEYNMIWIWLQYNMGGIFNHNNLGCSGAKIYQLTCPQIVKCLSNFTVDGLRFKNYKICYRSLDCVTKLLYMELNYHVIFGFCSPKPPAHQCLINSVVQIILLALSWWKFMSTLLLIEHPLAKFKVSSLESTSITSGSSVIVLCREEKIDTLFDIHRLSTNLRVVHWKLIWLKYD